MDLATARAKAAELAANITKQLQEFETATGLTVHSIPVLREAKRPITARVKVQL